MSKTTALLATLISIGLLSGCGKNDVLTGPEGGSASDRAQISDVLARNPQYVDEEISQSEDPVGLARIPRGAATEAALATITPLNFYRHIRHVDRTFEF